MPRLREMVKVLRSKNAGPFALTFDILFKDESLFRRALASGAFAPAALAALLDFPTDRIRVVPFPPAWAIKVTVPRRHSSGSFDDTDVFGCQQHAPLLDLEIA
ncbi:MAG: DUF4387 domain-containing protein [Proteobacteria bacterium]|nr:DUF4387 domain-containing protein [Pseudomonadota bacterium]